MARLPHVTVDTAPEPVADALRQMPAEVGLVHLLAHAETCLRPLLRLGQAILTAQALAPDLRELAILRTARLTGVNYMWTQHENLAKLVGVPEEKIEAVRSGVSDGSVFSPVERDVLAFTESVVRDGDADDDTYAAVAEHLSGREIVELTIAIGYYQMLGNAMNVTRVDAEPAAEVEIDDLRHAGTNGSR